MVSAVKLSPSSASLWDQAFQSLTADLRKSLEVTKTHRHDVLDAVLKEAEAKRGLASQKRWKFTTPSGDVIIVRDVLEKLVGWVHKFKEVGDIAVQYDPAHAALPWAAVRFLLQVSVSEIQAFANLACELERIARMLARYRVFEQLYLRGTHSEIELGLEDALTRLYAQILTHLGYAVKVLGENTMTRLLKSPFRTMNEGANELLSLESDVNSFAKLSDAETLQVIERNFTRLATQNFRSLSEDKYNQILEWLSVAPYYHHHQFIVQGRLHGVGQWLLDHKTYNEWQVTSSPSIILIHGILGSGKSTLCSVVVDCIESMSKINQSAAPLAYFYCANPEFERGRCSSDNVMRTVLAQLALDKIHQTQMKDFLCSEYERQVACAGASKLNLPKLTTKDCVRLILELAEQDPMTIVLDGLDIVEEKDLPILTKALKEIVSNADNVVKIFVTSRSSSRIAMLLEADYDIQITRQETQRDMKAFVNHLVDTAVDNKLLLGGNVDQQLQSLLRQTVLERAGEMFLWAKLQVERLCRETVEDDAIAALWEQLPEDIDLVYQESLNYVFKLGAVARDIAIKALSWVLYMKEPLAPSALLRALAVRQGSTLELAQLISICANLVVLDTECNVLRFTHQSVQEFLSAHDVFAADKAHTLLAAFCVKACSLGPVPVEDPLIPSDDLYRYAAIYWPVHSKTAMGQIDCTPVLEALTRDVLSFVFDEDWETTLSFDSWVGYLQDLLPSLPRDHTMKPALDAITKSETGFLFLLSIFGLDSILGIALSKIDWLDVNQPNGLGHTPVYLAAAFGHPITVEMLVKRGANINVECGNYGSPLHAACFAGHLDVVNILLEHSASFTCGSVFKNAIQAAFRGNREDIAWRLLEFGSTIRNEDEHEEALEEAAFTGFVKVFQRLQLPPFSALSKKTTDRMKNKIRKAIQGGQIGVIRQFLGPKSNHQDTFPLDAVALATVYNHKNLVEFLLNQGMNVEAEGAFGTPLRTASLLNYPSIVRLLLDRGAQVNSSGTFGDSLQAAALKGNTLIMRLLIQEGADVNQHTGFYGSALQAAAYHGQLEAVEILLDAKANVHEEGYSKDAFHAAAEGGHQNIITLMLRKGYTCYITPPGPMAYMVGPSPYRALMRNASPRYRRSQLSKTSWPRLKMGEQQQAKPPITDIETVFRVAEDMSKINVSQLETQEGSGTGYRLQGYSRRENFPLEAAASAGHQQTVAFLLEHRSSLGIPQAEIHDAIKVAASSGHSAVCRVLIRHNENREPIISCIKAMLLEAQKHQQLEVMEFAFELASNHCSVDECASLRESIFTKAEKYRNGAINKRELLLDFSESCQTGDAQLTTAILESNHQKLLSMADFERGLQLCASNGQIAIARLLLEALPLQDRRSSLGEEELVVAAANGFVDMMKLFVSFWPNLLSSSTNNALPRALTVASKNGHIQVVRYLVLDLAVDVNTHAVDKGYGSMLENHDAIRYGGYSPCTSSNFPTSEVDSDVGSSITQDQLHNSKKPVISPLQASLRGFARFSQTRYYYDDQEIADQNQQEGVISFLLNNGSDPNDLGGQTMYPIQLAAKYCPEPVVKCFIVASADVNVQGHGEQFQEPSHPSGFLSMTRRPSPGENLSANKNALFAAVGREIFGYSIVRTLVEAGAVIPKDHDEQSSLIKQALRFFKGDISRNNYNYSTVRDDPDGYFTLAPSLEYVFLDGPAAVLFYLLSQMPHYRTVDVNWTLVLQMAAFLDERQFVDLLLCRGTDVNATGYYYGTALQAAARCGHDHMVQKLLDAGANVNVIAGLWRTALRAAVVDGHESTVQILLNHGADVHSKFPKSERYSNYPDEDSDSMLQLGVKTGNLAIVKSLIARGATPVHGASVSDTQHELIIAASKGCADIVEALIHAGAPVDVQGSKRPYHDSITPDDASPLHAASARGHLDVVKALVSCGANIEGNVDRSGTPLSIAAANGKAEVVRYLLSAGASADDATLIKAVRIDHIEIAQELLAKGLKPSTRALVEACRPWCLRILEFLLEKIPNTEDREAAFDEAFAIDNLDDSVARLLLSYANPTMSRFLKVCAFGSASSVKYMINQGNIDVNQPAQSYGDFPLQVAALHLNTEAVQALLSRGANVECRNSTRGPPLITALESCATATLDTMKGSKIQKLMERLSLPTNLRHRVNRSFFYEASTSQGFLPLSKCEEIVKLLTAHGATVNTTGRPIGAPLHVACLIGSKSMVELLLESGADLDLTDGYFEKPIFAAIQSRHQSVLSLLLDLSSPLNYFHAKYATPLHHACAINDGASVRKLLEHGANTSTADGKGRTPLRLALESKTRFGVYHHRGDRHVEETPLEVIFELVKPLLVSDDDLVAAASLAAHDPTAMLRLVSSRDENAIIPEHAICRALSTRYVGQELVNHLMQRNGGIGVTTRMLKAVRDEKILQTLLKFEPLTKITADILASQKDLKCMELLLKSDTEVSVTEEVVFRALKLGNNTRSSGSSEDGEKEVLEDLLHRNPEIHVTQEMLKAARREVDLKILLDHLLPGTRISNEVAEAISQSRYGTNHENLRMLLAFDSSIRITPKIALRVINPFRNGIDGLEMLLEHDSSLVVTPKMFLQAFGKYGRISRSSQSGLVDLLHKHKKRVVFTKKVQQAVDDAYPLESEAAQRAQLYSLRDEDESYAESSEDTEHEERRRSPSSTSSRSLDNDSYGSSGTSSDDEDAEDD